MCGSSFSSRKMLPFSSKSIANVAELLLSKQNYIHELKEQMKGLKKVVAHNEVEHIRVRLLLHDQVALDNGAKFDLDVMKVNLEVALISLTIFVEKIEELKQQIRFKERTSLQTQ
jgi:hypothetical protein